MLAEVRKGITDTWAIGLGLIPLGIPFGFLLVQTGFAWYWAPVFSTVIYAGSMEFLAISLVTTGIGVFPAALTGFMVNFRHIFYGLSFPRNNIHSRLGRVYSTYALTDESYAIASTKQMHESLSGARILTIQIMAQALWVCSGLVGALFGSHAPHVEGMNFALVALFVVLAMEAFQAYPDRSLPITAIACAGVGWFVGVRSLMVVALGLYLVIVAIRFVNPHLDKKLRMMPHD